MESIGYRFYFLFVVCNVTNALFFWVFLPETARRPLEQMNEIFSSKSWVVIGKSTSYGGATNDVESHVDKTEVTHEAEKRQN